jgi:hypothetical protein
LDGPAALNEDLESEHARLLRESARFGDDDLAVPRGNSPLEEVIDAAIGDPPP